MTPRPYIGITGIVTAADLYTVRDCCALMPWSHRLMAGVLVSAKTMESTPTRAVIVTRRKGTTRDVEKVWTAEDARRAQLSTPMWGKYPAQMLRHRCASDLARQEYPDVLLGVYTPDELTDGAVFEDAATEAPSAPAALAPQEEFATLLADTLTLADAAALLRRLSQRIHAVGAAEIASEHLASWLDARGHVLTATDQRAIERGDWPAEMLDVLDALAECETGADVLRWWPAMAPVVDALGAHAKPTKTVVARTYCARENIATTQPARVFAAALAPKPPPTGTDSPSASSQTIATGDAANATTPAASVALAALPDWTRSAAAIIEHVATEYRHPAAVLSGARKWGLLLGATYLSACADRLAALDPSMADHARGVVDRAAVEGPRQRKAA